MIIVTFEISDFGGLKVQLSDENAAFNFNSCSLPPHVLPQTMKKEQAVKSGNLAPLREIPISMRH